MGTDQPSLEKSHINKELLAILCCPETKQDLSLIGEELLRALNETIERGELKNKAGKEVREKIDGGLIRADRKVVYVIRDQIPIMLIEESIPVDDFIT